MEITAKNPTIKPKFKYERYTTLKEGLYQSITSKWISILYSCLLVLSITDVLQGGFFSPYTLGVFFGTVAMYILFDFVNRAGVVGKLVYIVILTAVWMILRATAFSSYSELTVFLSWFFGDATNLQNEGLYSLITVIGFTFFISSVVYYFTVIQYRRLTLIMISFIPCVLYVKREVDLPYVYMVLIIGLFLLIMADNEFKGLSDNKKIARIVTKGGLIFMGGFSALAVILSLIVPKSEDTPQKIDFEKLAEDAAVSLRAQENMARFSRYSGNADSFDPANEQLLFTVYTASPTYYRRQVFNSYNGEYWDAGEYIDNGVSDWRRHYSELNYTDLAVAINRAMELDDSFATKYNLPKINPNRINDDEVVAIVTPNNFSATFFINPLRSINVTGIDDETPIFRNQSGETFYRGLKMINDRYNLRYYDEKNAYKWLEMINGSTATQNKAEWKNMLLYAQSILNKSGEKEMTGTIKDFITEYSNANTASSDATVIVSDNVKAFAEQLTEGLTTDYEKALTLQNYFLRDGFVYDLKYRPPTGMDTVDYFLFESKTGTCSDFATAFCLMADSVGLTFRYVGGYTYTNTEYENVYTISNKNAHAFPEVYIAGTGWMTFEPTVPADESNQRNVSYNLSAQQYVALGVTILIAIIVIFGGIYIIPIFKEKSFRKKIFKVSPDMGIIMLYNRMTHQMGRKMKLSNITLFTPQYLKGFTKKILNTDISQMVNSFERACYSNNKVTEDERLNAFDKYITVFEILKKIKRKR